MSLGSVISDDGGTCATGSVIGGANGSSRRGAFGSIYTHIRRGGCGQRLYTSVTASSLCRTKVPALTSPCRAISDGVGVRVVGVCVIGSTTGSVRRNMTNGGGESGTRRGAFGSIRIHIRRGGCGQRLGGGCGRRRGVVSNTSANVRKEGGYVIGIGKGGRDRN